MAKALNLLKELFQLSQEQPEAFREILLEAKHVPHKMKEEKEQISQKMGAVHIKEQRCIIDPIEFDISSKGHILSVQYNDSYF